MRRSTGAPTVAISARRRDLSPRPPVAAWAGAAGWARGQRHEHDFHRGPELEGPRQRERDDRHHHCIASSDRAKSEGRQGTEVAGWPADRYRRRSSGCWPAAPASPLAATSCLLPTDSPPARSRSGQGAGGRSKNDAALSYRRRIDAPGENRARSRLHKWTRTTATPCRDEHHPAADGLRASAGGDRPTRAVTGSRPDDHNATRSVADHPRIAGLPDVEAGVPGAVSSSK